MKQRWLKGKKLLLYLLIILGGLFPLFQLSPLSMAARRRTAIDSLDHDFPYQNCSLKVIDADVRDVIRAFADKYKLNIIMSKDVKGTISIIVHEIPVKEAFKNILGYSDLGYTKENNVYRIKLLQNLLNEEKLNQKAKNLKTEIISLKHADAERLVNNLAKFKSNLPETVINADTWTNSIIIKDTEEKIQEMKKIIEHLDVLAPQQDFKETKQTSKILRLQYLDCLEVAKIANLQGKVSTHVQTNSVILTDTPENLPRLEAIIKELDKPIPQILIEAKIVEISKNYSHAFGIQWGGHVTAKEAGKSYPTLAIGGPMGGKNYNQDKKNDKDMANYAVNLPGASTPAGAIDFLIGNINDKAALNIRLSAMEESGDARIISQPRIMTLDNSKASISMGETIQLPYYQGTSSVVISGQGENTYKSERTTEKSANTELIVTPHIISDTKTKLTIHIKRNTPDYSHLINEVPIILTREAKTELIINDGDTAVIGGLTTTGISNHNSGVPWLSQLPLFGWLFKSKGKSSEQGELLVFITPHIIHARDNDQVAE